VAPDGPAGGPGADQAAIRTPLAYSPLGRIRTVADRTPGAVMSTTVRARLQLMMMAVLLPGLAAALFVVARTYQGERDAVQGNLRSSALAISQVIDRELARRRDIAESIATSHILSREPADDPDLIFMHGWCSRTAERLGGWVELRSATHMLLDTRTPAGTPPRPLAPSERHGLSSSPQILPMVVGANGVDRPALVVHPVQHAKGELLNLIITMPPDAVQRIVDVQRLPEKWVGTVMDNGMRVIARFPGGDKYVGRMATPDLQSRLKNEAEGDFTSVTLDGIAVHGYFSQTPQGWSYVTAAPRGELIGEVPAPVVQVVVGSLLLLALAAASALWVGRRIARAADSLKVAANALQAGVPVLAPEPTGVTEFDAIGETLAVASRELAGARQELERQVASAVARTRQAEQRAAQVQRITALGRLTGGVAHDFNNLLGVISNSAHLIERHAEQTPALRMPVAVTLRAVETGSHLSQQLLRFGGHQAVAPRPVELAHYLPEMSQLLQIVTRKNIEVTVDVRPGTSAIKVDPSELELALINVALNARDAMPRGGVLRVQARNAERDEVEDLPPGSYVLLAVSDNGEGLDEELISHVFEPFFTTKAVGQGTGLGLSQVHGFCVQAGGTARMASTVGLGSTVTLVLPVCEPEVKATPGDAQGSPAEDERSVAGARVLLVEDNEELADVTVLLLQSYGCIVTRACDADDARRQLAEDSRLQVVLTDVVMPGQHNGVDLARELRKTRPSLPVVLISGYSAALTGLTGFTVLRKPVSADVLVRALAAALKGVAPSAMDGTVGRSQGLQPLSAANRDGRG